jgi:hypothetical protein
MRDGTKGESVPARPGYGSGIYRRRIVLESSDGEVRGELADDFHHFAVRVIHDGERAIRVDGDDVRVPWTTCPGAIVPLRRMEGAPLSDSILEVFGHTRPREQCTHLHDLACLALTHAARGETIRRYDVSVPDRIGNATEAVVCADDREVLRWWVRGTSVERSSPVSIREIPLGGIAFLNFLRHELVENSALAEAAWILQRAIFIGHGRRHDFEAIAEASAFAPVVGAACHTFDPSRVANAKRVHGTVRDFTDAPERILDRDPKREPDAS